MKNWKTIPIPDNIFYNCELDSRGLIVPYNVLKDSSGKHFFKVNDQIKQLECDVKKLCTICGTHLQSDTWFIGGPMSAFHKHGVFNDSPMHYECGKYALQVCPYLAYSGYTANTDIEKLTKQIEDNVLLYNPTQDDSRVPLFVFAKAEHFTITPLGHYKVEKPYLEIEYWNDGVQLDDSIGIKTVIEHFKEKDSIDNLETT